VRISRNFWNRRLTVANGVMWATVLCVCVLVLYPIAWLTYRSFTSFSGFTFSHYVVLLDQEYLGPLLNTLILAVGVVALTFVLTVPVSWAVARTNMPMREFVRLMMTMPIVTPPFLLAIGYVLLLGPHGGLITRVLKAMFGLEEMPFNIFSMGGMIALTTFTVIPFMFLPLTSAFDSISPSLEQTARIHGASPWKTFIRVTLPLIRPGVVTGIILVFVETIAIFGIPAVVGIPAKVFVLTTKIYALFTPPVRLNEAAALSVVLILISSGALWIYLRLLRSNRYVTVTGRGALREVIDLGAWKYVALVFSILVILAAVVLPYGMILIVGFMKALGIGLEPNNFSLVNFKSILLESPVTIRAFQNSFVLAMGAATVALVIGYVVAVIDQRTQARGRRLLDYLAFLPLGIPGTAIAVGLLFAWSLPPLVLASTTWIILVAYVVRYLPFCTRTANAALRQIHSSLEESARIHGASWLRTQLRVTVPLIAGGLFAGWLLVFMPSLRELNASILLHTPGAEVVGTQIISFYNQGFFEQAAAMGVVILVVSFAVYGLARYIVGARFMRSF
jgi:iron(III) transport system permease protein